MTSDIQPYAHYKDSGIPWLGKVPAHWNIRAAKRLFAESGERARPGDIQLSATQSHGVIPQAEYERLVGRKVVRILNHLDKRKHVEKDDFIISMRSFQGGLERAWASGAIRSSYVVLKPVRDARVPYFAHLFKSHPYIQALRSTSQFIRDGQDLTFANFSKIPLPVVPPAEQDSIAKYLDDNATKVRRFIRNRRRLIEVLNEQKQAIIGRAITLGLNPNVDLKPSGIDWLGNVPKHWDIQRLQTVIQTSVAGAWGDDPTESNRADHITCVRVADFDMASMNVSPRKLTTRAIPEKARHLRLLQQGDILLEKSGGGEAQPVGRVVAFDLRKPAVSSNFITLLRPNPVLVHSPFLLYVLTFLQASRRNLPSIKQTTGIQNLSERHYFSNACARPPLDEQHTIVAFLENYVAEIRRNQTLLQREIELIQEYRTRLIADVVTGKMDVRGFSPTEIASPDEPMGAPIDAEGLENDEAELVEDAAHE